MEKSVNYIRRSHPVKNSIIVITLQWSKVIYGYTMNTIYNINFILYFIIYTLRRVSIFSSV